MILLVMYQLKSPEAVSPLCEAIESFGPSCHFFDSFFLLCSKESPLDLQKALHLCVDGQVDILVSPLAREHTEYLPRKAHDWLAAHHDWLADPGD